MRQIKIYGDIGSIDRLRSLLDNPVIEGFTTNPSLMAKGGVKDYEGFAKEALELITKYKPNACISFEVFSDDEMEMREQAEIIHSWGKDTGVQVYVKIPILNINGSHLLGLIESLSLNSIPVNVTCVTNASQYFAALGALMQGKLRFIDNNGAMSKTPHIISIFAGRIADTGIDPKVVFEEIAKADLEVQNIETLWASPREILNVFQAEEVGCDIITLHPEFIAKIPQIGRHLRLVSIDCAKTFFDAAKETGYKI